MDLTLFVEEAESSLVLFESVFILGLLLITAVALLVRKVKIPYTVALVIAGLGLTFMRTVLPIGQLGSPDLITSEIILALFVPPLIFEGALHINWKTFRSNLVPILLMAVVGLLLATFIVGGVILLIAEMLESLAIALNLAMLDDLIVIPFMAAIAFGALISATDPVAVIAFFRSLGVEKRLSVLVEGESLLNDGMAIVIFKLALGLGALAAVSGGGGLSVEFDLLGSVWDFLKVTVGGIAVGLLVAKLAEVVFKYTDDRLVETTVTLPAAFGAYLLAENFHLSGILAVVAAGIYLGNIIPLYTTPSTKIALYNFWEMVAFIVTSLIFLAIGLLIDIRQLVSIQNIVLVISAVLAILVARALVVYGMSAISNKLKSNVPPAYQHVMFWGGLRGAISLALALSLTSGSFGPGVSEQLQAMTFGVVLFTLLVQGTTIERLIKKLGLAKKSKRQLEKERNLGQFYAARAAQEELNRLNKIGVVSGSVWDAMVEAQNMELSERDQDLRDMLHRNPGISMELAVQARYAMLNAERTAIGEAVRQEIISEEVHEQMLEDLDARIEVLDLVSERSNRMSLLGNEDNGEVE